MGSYVPVTDQDRQEMLNLIGVESVDQLYRDIPESVRIDGLNIPAGKSELEISREFAEMAGKNKVYGSIFRGAGAYNHFIPAIVKTVTTKEEFLTAYTPYQAEISQGILQNIFEYQTQMCELTGMDLSNASVYDGATAAAEAVFMCQERKKAGVIVAETVNPQTLEVVKTYCESRSVEVTVVPAKDGKMDIEALQGKLDKTSACVLVQSPNYFGLLEDMDAIVAASHEAGAKVIMSGNPISYGLLKTPGEYDVDIAIGEGQPLGMPISFGGPYLGYMTCKQAMMRKLPGRVVGETKDADGNRCFVLTLQAREQHIRREKASSNICSNQALCAMVASVYMAAVGPQGIRQVAVNSASNAHYLAAELAKIDGFKLRYDGEFFNEFITECPICPCKLVDALAEKNILAGLPVDGGIMWCCTEMNSKADMDKLVEAIKEVCA